METTILRADLYLAEKLALRLGYIHQWANTTKSNLKTLASDVMFGRVSLEEVSDLMRTMEPYKRHATKN